MPIEVTLPKKGQVAFVNPWRSRCWRRSLPRSSHRSVALRREQINRKHCLRGARPADFSLFRSEPPVLDRGALAKSLLACHLLLKPGRRDTASLPVMANRADPPRTSGLSAGLERQTSLRPWPASSSCCRQCAGHFHGIRSGPVCSPSLAWVDKTLITLFSGYQRPWTENP